MGKKCVPGVICFENVTIVVILFVLAVFVYYFYKISNFSNDRMPENSRRMMHENSGAINSGAGGMMMMPEMNRGFVFNNSLMLPPRMNDPLLDPYNPPLRDTSAYFIGGGGGVRGMIPINIPTQGPMMMTDEYRQVGLLTRANGSEMILPLMGQQLFTNRDKWNYYTMSDKNNIVKLPIRYKGRNCMNEYGTDSLNSGDHVMVEGYNDKFNVTIYDNKMTRYLPMV
jgi:hypothetical protein